MKLALQKISHFQTQPDGNFDPPWNTWNSWWFGIFPMGNPLLSESMGRKKKIYLFIYFGGVLKQIQGYSRIFYILISRPSAASLSVAIVMHEMILIAQFDHQFYAKCVSTYPLVLPDSLYSSYLHQSLRHWRAPWMSIFPSKIHSICLLIRDCRLWISMCLWLWYIHICMYRILILYNIYIMIHTIYTIYIMSI